jgi:hypothetical protein
MVYEQKPSFARKKYLDSSKLKMLCALLAIGHTTTVTVAQEDGYFHLKNLQSLEAVCLLCKQEGR